MKTAKILAVLALLATAVPSMSWAAETNSVTLGVDVFAGDQDNAKFREYQYKTDTPVNPYISLDLSAEPTEKRFYRLDLDARAQEDVDLALETGSRGVYKVGLSFQRFGHNFAFGARNIYAGFGTGHLTLDDATQSFLQGTSTSPVTAIPTAVRSVLAGAGTVDLGLRRDKVAMDLDWELTERVALGIATDYEKRKGTRPFGGNFGFGNAIELPEPIDYDTSNFHEELAYHGKSFHVSLSHSLSLFNNANHTLTFDNPFRATDNTASNAYQQTVLAGPATGRFALAPDNMANHVTAVIAQSLPMHSRLVATAGMGWLRQNEELAPVTTNSAVAGFPLSSPRSSAEAKVDTSLYSLRFTGRPAKDVHVKANYRYDEHNNKTPEFTISQWAISDANLYSGGAISSHYVSVVKRSGEAEIGFDLDRWTMLSFGYENEHANYDNGSANRENEHIYKLSLDTQKIKATELRFSLELANKKSDYPNYTAMELPWMRKYYAAARDRTRVLSMAHIYPNDRLTLGLEYTFGFDDYRESYFGVLDDAYQTATVDVGYQVTDRIMIMPMYTIEVYEANQRNRQWTPAGVGDPYGSTYSFRDTNSNWTMQSKDVIHTVGLDVETILIRERLTMKASGAISRADGNIDFASAIGTSANDANAYEPQDYENADDSTLISVDTSFEYAVKESLSLTLGYLYRRWKIKDDLKYDGYDRLTTTGAGAYGGLLSMDSMYKPYNVHGFFVQASYKF